MDTIANDIDPPTKGKVFLGILSMGILSTYRNKTIFLKPHATPVGWSGISGSIA